MYQYNEKENQDELNLGWLDFGPRMYMPELGRWGVIDAMSEAMLAEGPYNYVMNNPIRLSDPTGNLPEDFIMDWLARNKTHDDKKSKSHPSVDYAGDNYTSVRNDGGGRSHTGAGGGSPEDGDGSNNGTDDGRQEDKNLSWAENERRRYSLLLNGDLEGFINYYPNAIHLTRAYQSEVGQLRVELH